MRTFTAKHRLLFKGLQPEGLSIEAGKVTIFASSGGSRARCPGCGRGSSRAHSRYSRTVADLPWHGIPVTIRARVRRFFCDEASCGRRIFCERLPDVAARARKTDRLEEALLAIVFELGGRAGARLAEELGLVVGRDALLRRAKSAPLPDGGKVRVLGVDDFAFRKGHAYGTLLVDLERGRVVDLLPERSQESLVAWLKDHPEVEFAARDRSHIYREALTKGAPDAAQVTDRWHTSCTTSRTCSRTSCSTSSPSSAGRPRRGPNPKTGATTPSVPGPSCRTGRGTTTARSRRRPGSDTSGWCGNGRTYGACTWRAQISGTFARCSG
ncbi:MAG: ISL3 family transposase [Actinomycetota bacterium]|nr:ISL3 family transposase [Actinomycetota bacterium]